MNAKRTVVVALAALLAVTSVAAATPAGQAGSHASETAAVPDTDTDADTGAKAGADVAAAVSEDDDGDGADEDASGDAEATEDANGSAAASGSAADTRGERGPPETLPTPVPDHVSEIRDTVDAFLSGDLDGSLGDALSALLGGGGKVTDAEVNADTAPTDEAGPETTATATATPA
jgi:hypothetical protein